ncbi:MAG: HYR domain-containing protein [Thermoleophilia bacterium]
MPVSRRLAVPVLGALAALAVALPAAALDAPAGPPALNGTGDPLEADACTIRAPGAQAIAAGLPTHPVRARVYEATLTEAPGAAPGVVAQLGLGPAGSDPRTSPDWAYVDASYSLQAAGEDEYEATLTAPAEPGEYAYAYRFSLDGGGSFTYCDTDGAGSGEGLAFEPDRLGLLTVMAEADTTPPVLDLPDEVVAEATGPAGAEVAYDASAADAVDGATPATCAPGPGAAFPLGTTVVECAASDAAGNAAAGAFPVRVRDTTAPALDLPAALTREATGPDGAIVTYPASAADLVDGPVAVRCAPESGMVLPLGRVTVDCSARDRAGNGATGSFGVDVVDTTPPVIATPGDLTVAATSEAGADVAFDASASDAVDGAVPVACTPSAGAALPVGATAVTCTATDARGNEAVAGFTATVTPFEPLPAVSVLDGRAVEGSDGTTTALDVPVRLSRPAGPAGVTVHLATADGTAVAGEDYVATEAEVRVPAGEDSATATVPVVADADAEPDETFGVAITGAEGAHVERAEAVATILDDDRPPPAISVDDARVVEGDAGTTDMVFPVRLSATSPRDVTVGWSTDPGTAIYGDANDLLPAGGTVTIPAGRTTAEIAVPVAGETLPELDETFSVALADPSGATIDRSTAAGTIVNDDAGDPCIDAEGDGGDHPFAFDGGGAHWATSTGHTLCTVGDRDLLRPEGLAVPPEGIAHMWAQVTVRGARRGARTRVALPGSAAVIRGDGTAYVETRGAGAPFLIAVEGAGGTYDVTAGLL